MWLSLYVYYGEDLYSPEIDRLLLEVVAPLLDRLADEGAIRRFFFVRYQDPEAHLRLRLELGSRTAEAVERQVRRAVAELDGSAKVRRVGYEPELERYGGARGVPVAEEEFHLSSRVALELLAANGGERSRRFGKTLFTSVILVHAFLGDRGATAKFLAGYAEAYASFLRPPDVTEQDLGERLAELDGSLDTVAAGRALDALLFAAEAGEGFGVDLLDRWARGTSAVLGKLLDLEARGELELPAGSGVHQVVGSYLHMHHNRLGLSIPQEVYLTHLAADALAEEETTP